MRALMLIGNLLLFTYKGVNSGSVEECLDGVPNHIFHGSKLAGEWFVTVGTELLGDLPSCVTWQSFAGKEDAISYVARTYHPTKGTYSEDRFSLVPRSPGNYGYDFFDESRLASSLEADLPADKNIPGEMIRRIKSGVRRFVTDYSKYIIDLVCEPEGRRSVYFFTPYSSPTARDVVFLWNKLVEFGKGWGSVPLYLSGCGRIGTDLGGFKKSS